MAAARLVRDPDTDTGVPGAWRPLLRAMTSRAPEHRPPLGQVRDRLDAIAGAEPHEATAPVPVARGRLRGDRTDPDATALLHTGGATSVLPDPVAPLAIPDPPATPRDRSRPAVASGGRVAAGTAALLVVLLAGLARRRRRRAARHHDDGPRAEGPTTERCGRATDATTVPTTVPPTTLAPVTTVSGFPFDGSDAPGQDKKDKGPRATGRADG